jgi:hypothetical protein
MDENVSLHGSGKSHLTSSCCRNGAQSLSLREMMIGRELVIFDHLTRAVARECFISISDDKEANPCEAEEIARAETFERSVKKCRKKKFGMRAAVTYVFNSPKK